MKHSFLVALALATLIPYSGASAQSLRGSPASLDVQNEQARRHDFSHLRSGAQVEQFARLGLLVRLDGDENYSTHAITYPYVRPEVKLFVERLSAQYRRACGEPLVVTSATRPASLQSQLKNGSDRSVHPTGMAIDLRKSTNRSCQRWLEGVLLDLEKAGTIEATAENYPPHYHVAVFPTPYRRYVQGSTPQRSTTTLAYRVRQGDTLWGLAKRHGTTVDRIQKHNDLPTAKIVPGQTIEIPKGR